MKIKYCLLLTVASISSTSFAQSSCFTNCMSTQQNNPSAGAICTTTCDEESTRPRSMLEGFTQGYESVNKVLRDEEHTKMIKRARTDCNNGIQAGCDWLRRNNIY